MVVMPLLLALIYAFLNASIALHLLTDSELIFPVFCVQLALNAFSNAVCAEIFVVVLVVSLKLTVVPSIISVAVALP